MDEKNSQEIVTESIESIESIEIKIDNNKLSSEKKSDILDRTKQHRENICSIIVPQYIDDPYVKDNNYAVTYNYDYSKYPSDKSVLGWTIEENGQQQPDIYFDDLKEIYEYALLVLYKRTLIISFNKFLTNGDGKYLLYLF